MTTTNNKAKKVRWLTPAELAKFRVGDYALVQNINGKFQAANLKTGRKSEPRSILSTLRILRDAAGVPRAREVR